MGVPFEENTLTTRKRALWSWAIYDRANIFNEAHLRRVLKDYFEYYNRLGVHQSLEIDAPQGRKIQSPEQGNVIAIPHVGGLRHTYEKKAASP